MQHLLLFKRKNGSTNALQRYVTRKLPVIFFLRSFNLRGLLTAMAHLWVRSKVASDRTFFFMKPLEFESTVNEPHTAVSALQTQIALKVTGRRVNIGLGSVNFERWK